MKDFLIFLAILFLVFYLRPTPSGNQTNYYEYDDEECTRSDRYSDC